MLHGSNIWARLDSTAEAASLIGRSAGMIVLSSDDQGHSDKECN
jgi:hypothetical protein